jgi:ABC-type lipoprotein release transport system permease subunit
MWGDIPAIGQRFIFLDHLREVVGVVEDGKYHEITESAQSAVFLPLSQNEQVRPTFVVRSNRSQTEMAPAIEQTLRVLEPDALITVQSWPDTIASALLPARAATAALGVMGLFSAMLAVTGIFGMAMYNVSRRMKELGIRLALGARSRHVISAAVGRPIVLLAVGSLAGLLVAIVASPLLARIVYQANPRDPVVMAGAVLTMALLGMAASAAPALRAIGTDPSKLLREE